MDLSKKEQLEVIMRFISKELKVNSIVIMYNATQNIDDWEMGSVNVTAKDLVEICGGLKAKILLENGLIESPFNKINL